MVRSPFTQPQIMHLMRGEFSRSRRYKIPLSCMVVRIDRLLGLTEAHGEEFRTSVLRELCKLLTEKIRVADQLGTLQANAFLVLLPHTSALQAQLVAERIRTAFSALVVEVDDNRIPVTLSIGVAAVQDQETLFFDSLLSQAEAALEWASEAGGDRVCAFETERFRTTSGDDARGGQGEGPRS